MISYFENLNHQFKRLPNIEKWNYISNLTESDSHVAISQNVNVLDHINVHPVVTHLYNIICMYIYTYVAISMKFLYQNFIQMIYLIAVSYGNFCPAL